MMHIRKVLAATAATVVAVALAGCSSGNNPGQATSAAPTEPVTIEYLHRLPDAEGMTLVQDIADRWNADHPDIQVVATKFAGSSADMATRLETDIKAKAGPCLAQVGYSEVPDMFIRGNLLDVSKEAEQYKGAFSAGAWASMNIGDKQIGVPQDTGPLVYFYNAAEFEALGIEAPKTAEAFIDAAKKAAAAGKFIGNFSTDDPDGIFTGVASAAGDTWFGSEGDTWKIDMNGTGSQKVAAWWQQLLDDHLVSAEPRWGDGFVAAINDGSLIGFIGAGWNAGFALDTLDGTPAEGQWRIAQLPDFGAGQLTGPNGGSGVAVTAGCEHPAQAVAFAAWLNQQADDLASQGLIPAATAVPTTSAKMLRQFGGQNVMEELAKATANLNPSFSYGPGMSVMGREMAVAAAGLTEVGSTGKVTDVLAAGQKAVVQNLKDLGLSVAE